MGQQRNFFRLPAQSRSKRVESRRKHGPQSAQNVAIEIAAYTWTMRIYMQARPDPKKPPEFCQLVLEQDLFGGWRLTRNWGTQGRPGRVVEERYDTLDGAQSALLSLRDQQLHRGYKVVFLQGSGR